MLFWLSVNGVTQKENGCDVSGLALADDGLRNELRILGVLSQLTAKCGLEELVLATIAITDWRSTWHVSTLKLLIFVVFVRPIRTVNRHPNTRDSRDKTSEGRTH